MGIPGNANLLLLTEAAGAAPTGYEITRSLRFNSGDSAYLNRTPSSAGNQTTWTWSGWVKRSAFDTTNNLFVAGTSAFANIRFANQNIDFTAYNGSSYVGRKVTSAVYRDPSAWYHIVCVFDTTNATAADRMRVYVNGVREESFSTSTDPTQNATSVINSTIQHRVGTFDGSTEFFNGYLADVHFIDGQALAATDFGEYDATTGVWNPIAYTGSYGTNGFHLDFSDATSTTTIAEDSSGNNNDWTANNISVVPTYSGNVTDTASPSGSSMIIKAVGSTVTGTFNAAEGTGGSINYYTSSDGNSWSFQETSSGESSSFTAKYISMGGGSNNVRQFTSTSGSYQYSIAGSTSLDNNASTVTVDQTGLFDDFSDRDSLFDSPTNANAASDTGAGGEVSGNYATWNSIDKASGLTLSNGNLDANNSTTAWNSARATIGVSSGKWYWEITSNTTLTGVNLVPGIGNSDMNLSGYWWFASNGRGYYSYDGTRLPEGTSYGATFTLNDVIGVALDLDAGTLTFYKNGSSQGQSHSGLTGTWFPIISLYGAVSASANFGQRPFAYTAPTGYQPLTTALLDDPTIADGSTAMDVVTWVGDGNDNRVITTSFSPEFLWLKRRDASSSHRVSDVVRGNGNILYPEGTYAEAAETTTIKSLGTTGFTLGTSSGVNAASGTYVGWYWDGGSSTVSNTDGSITSSVRANASAGFSIVSWTGNEVSGSTIGHGLGVAPSLIITKRRTGASVNWGVYHSALGATKYLWLDSTNAASTDSAYWYDTAPTSSVFTVGNSGSTNALSMIAYCWAPVEGYSAFGRFYGNSSSDGVFQYCGFTPRWIMMKRDDGSVAADWRIIDTARSPYNVADAELNANLSDAESTVTIADIVSNGFKLRTSANGINGGNYISWAAFASHPFKYARAR